MHFGAIACVCASALRAGPSVGPAAVKKRRVVPITHPSFDPFIDSLIRDLVGNDEPEEQLPSIDVDEFGYFVPVDPTVSNSDKRQASPIDNQSSKRTRGVIAQYLLNSDSYSFDLQYLDFDVV